MKTLSPSGGFIRPVRAVVSREEDLDGDVRTYVEVLECGHKVRCLSLSKGGRRRCARCPAVLGRLHDEAAIEKNRLYQAALKKARGARRRSGP